MLTAVTSNPDCSRLALKAWKFKFGLGMYGRDTFVGHQNSILTGSDSPALRRSALAWFGLYGYFVTLGSYPGIAGGMNSLATTARPAGDDRTSAARRQ